MTTKTIYRSFSEYLKAEYQGPYMATDIVIRYANGKKNGIVLIERKFPPFGLALPGGIAEKMTFAENAVKESREETGLDVELDNPDVPLCVLSEVNQDPRTFIASVTYTAIGRGQLKPCKDEDAKSATLYSLDEIRNLLHQNIWAFPHHKKILRIYLEKGEKYDN